VRESSRCRSTYRPENTSRWATRTRRARDWNLGSQARSHRSARYAYPLLLTFVNPTETVFRACSGAVVANVFQTVEEHGGIPDWQGLQVEPGVLGDNVTLITITMGGNDVDFAKVLSFCSTHASCEDDPYPEPPSSPLALWVHEQLVKLRANLVDLYTRLHQAAPNARIVVLGYPPLFPEDGPGESGLRSTVCRLAFDLFSSPERELIRDAGVALNTTIASAAEEAGVDYVDVWPYFSGHEPCGSSGEWVRFVDSLSRGAIRDGSFHPLDIGQAMLARIVSCYLFLTPSPQATDTPERDYAMTGCVSSESVKVAPSSEPLPVPTETAPPTISPSPSP
jgi:lysophospholipase L1-like esterase